jgi:hypothetical protein
VTQKADGRYDHTKPWAQRPPFQPNQVAQRWQYNGPFASNAERLVQQALMVATVPGTDIQKMVRPPLPQIRLFPEKYGYDRKMFGIDDIVSIDRNYVEPRISWFSGGVAGYSGSARNDLGNN